MAWVSYNTFSSKVLIFLCTITAISAYSLASRRNDGLHLNYMCVTFHTEHQKGAPIIMLHGLGDSKETWKGIYQNLAFLLNREVCIYDARNHGDSSWNDTFTVDVLAEDIGYFMSHRKIEKAAFVGHSLGGLSAMRFALKNPDKVERVVVEDISPLPLSDQNIQSTLFFFQTMKDSLKEIPKDADATAAGSAAYEYIAKVLKLNITVQMETLFPLVKRDGEWQWKTNIDLFIKSLMDSESFFGKAEGVYNGQILFIYGAASEFKVGDQEEGIKKLFPNAEFYPVPKAGHVIHGIYREFLEELLKFMKRDTGKFNAKT